MFKNVTLEISLKPFKKTTDEYIKAVCEKAFEQWRSLINGRETISIMMWSSDGSELLDYSGDDSKTFEWCKYVGTANKPDLENLPKETSPHLRRQLYMNDPPEMSYAILKKIVKTFKLSGKKLFPESNIRVGTTFDIGPEFAVSDFKYSRHPEICKGSGCDRLGFVDATALLNGDNYHYAAYPNGIPDKTPMGTFLGAQADIFMKDMGFDYIWLSNGMGFCYEPWSDKGKIYDGEHFHVENLDETQRKIFLFWKLFRDACPNYPIETRGTNYSVGIDYASDGVPLYDIYKGNFNITPPPNSPWAAINDDIGIEMLGQLTRNCELPGNDYMFRYYIHDIWWMNSPWYDRYECQPYDIYLPMALSVINGHGKVQSPTLLNLLSIDNAKGELPSLCANEVIPHLLKAEKDIPDEPAPIILVYPFREFTKARDENTIKEMYFGDTFIKNAINSGFPLSTAISTDNFVKLSTEMYKKSVLLVPAFGDEDFLKKLSSYVAEGGKTIIYGSNAMLDGLNIKAEKVSIENGCDKLFDALEKFGYYIKFNGQSGSPLPAITLHRSDNALIFSVYNRDTTIESSFLFPLGAPIINGYDTTISNGRSHYAFDRFARGECRVFVKQENGKIRAKEESPVNMKYRRRIRITGLENADVALFGEEYCKRDCIVTKENADNTPIPESGFKVVEDSENGTYLFGSGISGTISICMPNKEDMS